MDHDTAKCNQWTSGFHTAEHALILSLTGQALAGETADLYFVRVAAAQTFVAPAYRFVGREKMREILAATSIAGTQHRRVRVT